MAEYFFKRGRFQTLMGDTIEKGFLKKAFKSADITTAALVTGAVALAYPENPAGAAISGAIYLAQDSLISRFLERALILRSFYPSIFTNLNKKERQNKSLAIDTAPDPQQSINSLHKYGEKIKSSRFIYTGLTVFNGGLIASSFAAAASAPDSANATAIFSAIAAQNGIALMRFTMGARRFNKLAKGEWAIVDEPEGGQKTLEKHLFNTPDISIKPSHAPQHITIPVPVRD